MVCRGCSVVEYLILRNINTLPGALETFQLKLRRLCSLGRPCTPLTPMNNAVAVNPLYLLSLLWKATIYLSRGTPPRPLMFRLFQTHPCPSS